MRIARVPALTWLALTTSLSATLATSCSSEDTPEDAGYDAGDELDAGEDAGETRDAEPPLDAGFDAAASDAGPPEGPNIVFTMSLPVSPGNLGGRADADHLCNRAADLAGLGDVGSYVAFLSTSTQSAFERLDGSRGWVRTDRLPFVDTPSDLIRGRIFYPPSLDELGNEVSTTVVTGTTWYGETDPAGTCLNWTSTAGQVRHGEPRAGTELWTDSYPASCAQAATMYCFGTGHRQAVRPPARSDAVVFLSRRAARGDAGLPAFDAICNEEAAAAGLDGTFVAFVSTTAEPATARLGDATGPWSRPDGVVVAESVSQLTSTLTAPITLTADGLEYDNERCWLGAIDRETSTFESTCGDWSSTTPAGRFTLSGSSTPLLDGANRGCSYFTRLLCFEI